MGSISSSTTISAPRSEVYNYVSDPLNAPHYISAIRRVTPTASGEDASPRPGQVWRADADLLGQPRHINLKLSELKPNALVRYSISGDPPVEIGIDLRSEQLKETEVELTVHVEGVPGFLLNGLLGSMLSRDLRRLKAIMEREG